MITFLNFMTEATAKSSLSPSRVRPDNDGLGVPSTQPEKQRADNLNASAFKRTAKKQKPTPAQAEALHTYTLAPSSMTKEQSAHVDAFLHAHPTEHEGHVYRGVSRSFHHDFEEADRKAGREVPYVDIYHPHPMSTTVDQRSASIFGHNDPDYNKYLSKATKKAITTPGHNPRRMKEELVHQLRLKVPKGHPAAYIAPHSEFEDNDNIMRHSDESEVLMPRDTTIRVYRHPTIHKKWIGFGSHQIINNHVTWHGEVLPHDHKDQPK